MSQMTADEASLLSESHLRPWVNLSSPKYNLKPLLQSLEKTLILCGPTKNGPFQSEIDMNLDMGSFKKRYGLNDDDDDNSKSKTVSRDVRGLGDVYSEYYLKKKGVLKEDEFLEVGWDKKQFDSHSDDEDDASESDEIDNGNNGDVENSDLLSNDEDVKRLMQELASANPLDDENPDSFMTVSNNQNHSAPDSNQHSRGSTPSGSNGGEDENQIINRIRTAEDDARLLRGRLSSRISPRPSSQQQSSRPPLQPQTSTVNANSKNQTFTYSKLDKITLEAAGGIHSSAGRKIMNILNTKQLNSATNTKVPSGEPAKAAIFHSRLSPKKKPVAMVGFDSRKLKIKPVLTSLDLKELAGVRSREAERSGSRGSSRGGTANSSRGGTSQSRPGSRSESRSGSRSGTANSLRRPVSQGSMRTLKAPANPVLSGLSISGRRQKDNYVDEGGGGEGEGDGLTPQQQYNQARKLIADMKKYNTTDHTWTLLQTPGLSIQEQKKLYKTDNQLMQSDALEDFWIEEAKNVPSRLNPDYCSKRTSNGVWAESALIAGIPLYVSGSMRQGNKS